MTRRLPKSGTVGSLVSEFRVELLTADWVDASVCSDLQGVER
jgi:hypothetical protein